MIFGMMMFVLAKAVDGHHDHDNSIAYGMIGGIAAAMCGMWVAASLSPAASFSPASSPPAASA